MGTMEKMRKQNGMLDWLTKKKVTYRKSVPKARKAAARARRSDDDETPATWTREDAEKALKRWKRMGYNPAKGVKWAVWDKAGILRMVKKTKKGAETYAKGMGGHVTELRKNPEAAAAELSEAWHGRPAKTATDVIEQVHYHGVLTDLGRLKEITVMVTARKGQKIFFDAETRLASSENGKQLYVVGGDQSLDLEALGIEGEEAEKDCVVVGDIFSIVYVTAKQHLGKEDRDIGPYEHELGEDSGTMPILIYDTMNQEVGFAGGSYFIDPTDYDGRHSAGIRN